MIVPFGPDAVSDADADPFVAALAAGIPAIAWCRDPDLGDRFMTEMRTRLDGRDLRELPALVLELRRDAQIDGSERHVGRHIGLLWDEPDRILESTSLVNRLVEPD